MCAVEGCEGEVQAHALCDKHYRRSRKGSSDRHCRYCGKPIDPTAHYARRYCSDECKQAWEYGERQANHRTRWLKQYGLTVEQFEERLASQGNRCAICRTDEVPTRGNWSVDHDHVTGKVRGILCHGCNVALGHFKDDPALLLAAIHYLEG